MERSWVKLLVSTVGSDYPMMLAHQDWRTSGIFVRTSRIHIYSARIMKIRHTREGPRLYREPATVDRVSPVNSFLESQSILVEVGDLLLLPSVKV